MTQKRSWMIIGQSMLLFLYLLLIAYVDRSLKESAKASFDMYPYILFSQLAYIPIGFILGSRHLFNQLRNKGKIRFDLVTLFWLALPALYILLVPYIVRFDSFLPFVMVTNPSTSTVVQVVFGYIVITSLCKEKSGTNSL